ncbi:MAG: DUF4910 domain-containing protein [Desulfitobacteriaceae bacterium]
MFQELLKEIRKEISGQRALQNVATIIQYHRIPGYKGQQEAAEACTQILRGYGIETDCQEYPADGHTMFWTEQSPPGWECDLAELFIVEESGERTRIASFAEREISVMQGSAPTLPEGIEVELVTVNKPEEEEGYAGLDVRGKMVLIGTCDMVRARELAVERLGAIGIVTDRMPEWPPARGRMDVPDAVHWNGFHWTGHEQKCFGFAISPRWGDVLRKREQTKVFAKVRTRFTENTFCNVEAFIPGEKDEEIVVIAHLCHPKPSANDNASGSGTAMEVARALQHMIGEGVLPKPKRGIRFLLVPEFLGTYAYLEKHEDRIPKMLAGINLDMVGEKQDLCHSSLQVERPSLASPGYVGDLAAMLCQALGDDAANFFGTARYALFRHTETPFSGGSDHYILSDPTVGIPTPMLIQWPDRFYHTSEDTLDKVDPLMLQRVGTITATYAYFLANAGSKEISWLASEIALGFGEEVHHLFIRDRDRVTKAPELMDFRFTTRLRDLKALEHYLESEEMDRFQELMSRLADHMRIAGEAQMALFMERADKQEMTHEDEDLKSEFELAAESMVAVRVYRGPVPLGLRGFLHLLSKEERGAWRDFHKKHPGGEKIDNLLLYWADGERNLKQICDLIERETGYSNLEFAVEYFKVLSKVGLIQLKGGENQGQNLSRIN